MVIFKVYLPYQDAKRRRLREVPIKIDLLVVQFIYNN